MGGPLLDEEAALGVDVAGARGARRAPSRSMRFGSVGAGERPPVVMRARTCRGRNELSFGRGRLRGRAADREDLQLRRRAAVRRRRRAADRDRDVLLAACVEDRRARRDLRAGLERPQDLPGLEVERAQVAVASACEAEAGRGRRDAAALGLGRQELPHALAGQTSIALIEPWSCQPCERAAEVAVLDARGRRRRARTCCASARASAAPVRAATRSRPPR